MIYKIIILCHNGFCAHVFVHPEEIPASKPPWEQPIIRTATLARDVPIITVTRTNTLETRISIEQYRW